jgi:hypothetical protein
MFLNWRLTNESDYWTTVIPAIKGERPDFKFIAEAYWDLEWELQQQGFDFCYDKRLYDRLEHDPTESVRLHLCADPSSQWTPTLTVFTTGYWPP